MGSVAPMGSTTLRLWRLALYLGWTVPLMPVQVVGLVLRRPWVSTFPRFYHRWCCRILGLRVRRIGQPSAARPVLFAANHVSYLDITVFGSLIPGSFVAKSEVAGWPLFGLLAKLQRSVFIDRQVRSTLQQRDTIAERLAARDVLILFPEGTSGDGNRVLPFKSALFGVAARPEASSLAVQPHLWRMLGLGKVEIIVEFHRPTTLAECGSRKLLARYCQERVAAGLEAALTGRRQTPPTAAQETPRRPVPTDVAAPALG
jgi:1-acyl-sn-glycerol-3-phosphate acyltransferase